MGFEYNIKDQYGMYFITCTVHQWVDVFTRMMYVDILLDSLRFCQREKGLKIYSWVIMTNHIHLIVSSDDAGLSNIIRDFKKFTSSKIFAAIESNENESRKRWLLWLFTKESGIRFWEDGYHGKEIMSRSFCESKVNYIHMNPVRAGIVEKEEEYLLSSCGDFYGVRKGLLDLAPL